eukprot:5327970-Amphidinium_carterae.1
MGHGLLSPSLKGTLFGGATAAGQSYQSALHSAQQLLGVHSAAASAPSPDLPLTRGRERGSGRALREYLEQHSSGGDANSQLL